MFIVSLIFFVLFLPSVSVSYANTLFLHIEGKNDTLSIYAETGTQTKSYQVKRLQDIEALYPLLQRRQIDRNSFEQLLRELGIEVFEPIHTFIESSSEIGFVMAENLVKLPLDLLYVKEIPLFLQKPITYSFTKINSQNLQFSNTLSALIISDKTADPENGTYFLKKLLPSSAEYYDIKDINLTQLESIQTKDVILISAHGRIRFDNNDCIGLGDEQISPSHLARLSPKLVYLDSC
ncbi:MAG: hypothetical protein BWK80_01895 [Desulfobacteraceae bacterium IS3]|nr:MAG: hypothetical protein BWK80_01895 [Desulfobacteraceae bacterium IS3]